MEYDLAHIREHTLDGGPVQPDEALLLFALVKVVRPEVVVEFGFSRGFSSVNFLKALPENSLLFSYDSDENCQKKADEITDQRFKFILKKQENFEPRDIDHRLIDVLFIDGAHDLEANIELFKKVKPFLKDDATVIVHDTGTWNKGLIPDEPKAWTDHMRYIEDNYEGAHLNESEFSHQPDERRFVNYLKSSNSKFQQVHLHSLSTMRQGLTILQKYRKLPLGPTSWSYRWKRRLKRILPKRVINLLRGARDHLRQG